MVFPVIAKGIELGIRYGPGIARILGIGRTAAPGVGAGVAGGLILNQTKNGANEADGKETDDVQEEDTSCPTGDCPPPEDEELETNPKHHPNSKSPEPKNAQELYNRSIADKSGVRWAKDNNGIIHRFSKPSNGKSH